MSHAFSLTHYVIWTRRRAKREFFLQWSGRRRCRAKIPFRVPSHIRDVRLANP
jgi:hypothetical protein